MTVHEKESHNGNAENYIAQMKGGIIKFAHRTEVNA